MFVDRKKTDDDGAPPHFVGCAGWTSAPASRTVTRSRTTLRDVLRMKEGDKLVLLTDKAAKSLPKLSISAATRSH